MPDSVKLDCTKYMPDDSETPALIPAVIFCHGFGGSKDDMNFYAQELAKYGYYTFTYSMRGQGKSGGLSNFISTTEAADLLQVIAYVKSDTVTNDDRIALMGSSQGGIISFMAGCMGANVKCIISDLASPEFASSFIENGCIKTTLLWSLSYPENIVRYNDDVKSYLKYILHDTKSNWRKLSSGIKKNRDFPDKVKDLNVPILISNSWQDKFFNTSGIIKAANNISAPFIMNFGAVEGHGSDTISEGVKIHAENIMNWLEYQLFDIPNDISAMPRFNYASSSNPVNYNHWTYVWRDSPVWPPEGITTLKYYFHPGMQMKMVPNAAPIDTVSFLNDLKDKKMDMKEALNYNFTGSGFSSKFEKTYIYFESDPLGANVEMTGIPEITLYYASTGNVCQYNFQIWEVLPNGEMNFVTRINYTDRDYKRRTKKMELIEGTAHSHTFWKGDRIRIYVTNIDNGPQDKFLGTNPYVLPVLKRARNYIYMGANNGSFISLPVIYR
jgi:ABC-2 type transport system ATP-binding protein